MTTRPEYRKGVVYRSATNMPSYTKEFVLPFDDDYWGYVLNKIKSTWDSTPDVRSSQFFDALYNETELKKG